MGTLAGMAGTITAAKISDGSTRYRARYRDAAGKQHEKRFRRKVDARMWLDQQTSALVTQTWTAPERGKVTLEEWYEEWLSVQTNLKPSTKYRYEGLWRAQIKPTWGAVRLADVTAGAVEDWLAKMKPVPTKSGNRTELAPSTVRQAHRVFSLLLTRAVRDGRIPRNPAVGVPLPRVVRGEPRFLTREEVEKLAAAAGDYGDVIRLLARTGLRFGELTALRVRRVDLGRRRITVAESATEVGGRLVFTTPKNHKNRTVGVPRSLVGPLEQLCEGKAPEDLLVTAPKGGPLRLRAFRLAVFDPARKAAGLPDVRPHDLRHTAASLAIASGGSVKSVQEMLGHASAAMTLDVYAGLFEDDQAALLDRMDAADAKATEARVGT